MDRDAVKARVKELIRARAPAVIGVAKDILAHPELGFRETRTAGIVADWFSSLGLQARDGIAITGLRAEVNGSSPGPTVAVMGELDSLVVPGHPYADSETGAAHACGHHAQLCIMLAVAAAVSQPEVRDALSGRVALMALPAEESIALGRRLQLVEQGKIEFGGGKPEWIRLGEFDDVDMAILTHATSDPDLKLSAVGSTLNGNVAKQVRYIGMSAHAGASPHRGINALNAAMLAISAIHAIRETFQDADSVRVHPIITKGGDAVNAVPADVRIEMLVRGKTLDAILDADRKVDRALKAGAMAVGAKVYISTLAGYLPLHDEEGLSEVYRANAKAVVGPDQVGKGKHVPASTDVGDVSQIMPAIQPFAGGASGVFHADDFIIDDYEKGLVNPAIITAMSVVDLLADGAAQAQRVLQDFKAPLTKQQYLDLKRKLTREEEFAGDAV